MGWDLSARFLKKVVGSVRIPVGFTQDFAALRFGGEKKYPFELKYIINSIFCTK